MSRQKVIGTSFYHIARTGTYLAVHWICGLLLTACSSVQPVYPPPDSLAGPEISTENRLTSDDLLKAKNHLDQLIANADFNRADALLKELWRRRTDEGQVWEIRRYKELLRRTSFLHHNPIELRILSPESIFPLRNKIPLSFEIFNLSDQEIVIPGQGTLSWLPWAEKRKSCILADYTLTDISLQDGSWCSGRWDEMLEFSDTCQISPGKAYTRCTVMDAKTPDMTLYRRIEVRAELIPGGLQTGPFDWGMIRFQFPLLVLHALPAGQLYIAEEPEKSLREALIHLDGVGILLASIFIDESMKYGAVEEIIRALPELKGKDRNMVIAALQWLTGEKKGYNVHQWMDWWDLHRESLFLIPEEACLYRKPAADPDPGPARRGETDARAGAVLPICNPAIWLGLLPDGIESGARVNQVGAGTVFDQFVRGLDDDYYCRRYASQKKLTSLGIDGLDLMTRLLGYPSIRVRAGAAEAMGKLKDTKAILALLAALEHEKEPLVKQRIVQALARSGSRIQSESLPPDFNDEELLRDLFIETALKEELEKVMHFGRTPGFYDGQFNALWEISDHVFDYLIKMAVDEDYAYQDRVLAIMALHEKKEKDILTGLLPLVMDPETEMRMEWDEFINFDITERVILDNRRRNLSKYARYSLAKAGMPKYNLDKIKVMKDWLQRNRDRVFREYESWEQESVLGSFDPY
ncbi:MAG: HEAT repeat domain-containing protein, partial [Planctomycetota bacterium]